jgi:hypothetical protein
MNPLDSSPAVALGGAAVLKAGRKSGGVGSISSMKRGTTPPEKRNAVYLRRQRRKIDRVIQRAERSGDMSAARTRESETKNPAAASALGHSDTKRKRCERERNLEAK